MPYCFLLQEGKRGFENTIVFLFARREARARAVAETADVNFFSTNGVESPKEKQPPFSLTHGGIFFTNFLSAFFFFLPLPIAE
jgi:hypothetical protein